MEKLIIPGRNIFAGGIAGLGVLCFLLKDFIVGRPPAWSPTLPVNPILAYISGTLLILCALAILLNKQARAFVFFIATLILCFSVIRHLPRFMNDWLNAYKAMALFGGSLIVAVSWHKDIITGHFEFLKNKRYDSQLILLGSVLLSIFFIASGYAHFKFAGFVFDFIPAYIPFRKFWTYFCGICLVSGGIGLLIPQTRTWAAFLMGLMILIWFVFLHIPRFFSDTGNTSDRMGLCESFTFVGILFVLAGLSHRKNSIDFTPKWSLENK